MKHPKPSSLDHFITTKPQLHHSPKPQRPTVVPLAEKLRPSKLSDIIGQEHITVDSPLSTMVEEDNYQSFIMTGPPGCGKTTIASIIKNTTRHHFVEFSAINSGKKEMNDEIIAAKRRHRAGIVTLFFVDEIHALNKLQQDIFLPAVERGDIVLIGATTENPSYEINNALLSRCHVVILHRVCVRPPR